MTMTEEYAALDEELAGPDPDWEAEPESPGGEEDADRLLRHLARVRREADAVTEVHNAELERIKARRDDRLAVLGAREDWLLESLSSYHAARLREDKTAKTLHLPCGTLKARKAQPVWEYEDEEAFISWAKANELDDLVRTKLEPEKQLVKQRLGLPALEPGDSAAPVLPDTGEAVPGLSVTARPPTFSADTGEMA